MQIVERFICKICNNDLEILFLVIVQKMRRVIHSFFLVIFYSLCYVLGSVLRSRDDE